ncbi:MAG: glycine--tRNA ligase [Mollicutes bacterium PWAP]|nr:glycine--tRNA ligase [Mollicutes bacterium PWAP]
MKNKEKKLKEIINHLKSTGFVFQGSEIYGGLSNTWDYGPLGVLLKENIKNLWWKEFILKESNNYGLDSKILMNPKVWEASGHVENFSDPLIENKINHKRYRADKIVEELFPEINAEAMDNKKLEKFIIENVKEYDGSKTNWTDIKKFHLMFETSQGVVEGSKNKVYLRPETAQGIFVNFEKVQRTMRAKIPFGIGQYGKSFRNEVTPGNFIFRTREFEQMELEYFVKPENSDKAYKYYVDKTTNFSTKIIGIKEESIKLRVHEKEELAHYSKGTTDIEFIFPFGWGELMGVANRSDFDLKNHEKQSGEKLSYRDHITQEIYTPYVIEPSIGLDRLMLAAIIDAYEIEEDGRIVMKLKKDISPYKLSVLPLSKKYHSKSAKKVFEKLIENGISVNYDEAGSIGKRYRRQDSIGTPICLTVIDETDSKGIITIRHRDNMKQETINIDDLEKYI